MKFLRRISNRYSKLGKRRKKKQIWKRPTGRHNKMRLKRKGYPKVVSIGYVKDQKNREKLLEKTPILVKNIQDLNKIEKGQIGVIGNIGKKKKIEIASKAQEKKIDLYNLNPKRYLKKNKKLGKKETEKINKNKIVEDKK